VQCWNPAAALLPFWDWEKARGIPFPRLPLVSRQGPRLEALFEGRKPFSKLLEGRSPEGALFSFDLAVCPLPSSGGHACFLNDRTETAFLEKALLQAREREQRRLGQCLHEHLCQALMGSAFSIKALSNQAQKLATADRFADLAESINDAAIELQKIAQSLAPSGTHPAQLMSALQSLAERHARTLACAWICPEEVLVGNPRVARQAYHLCQDAVQLSLDHWEVSSLSIALRRKRRLLVLEIRSHGRRLSREGAEPEAEMQTLMGYRAKAIRGKLSIVRQKNGLRVTCSFPDKSDRS
jgi:signal transduction histidine kinase